MDLFGDIFECGCITARIKDAFIYYPCETENCPVAPLVSELMEESGKPVHVVELET